jgi:hypothetical protein
VLSPSLDARRVWQCDARRYREGRTNYETLGFPVTSGARVIHRH